MTKIAEIKTALCQKAGIAEDAIEWGSYDKAFFLSYERTYDPIQRDLVDYVKQNPIRCTGSQKSINKAAEKIQDALPAFNVLVNQYWSSPEGIEKRSQINEAEKKRVELARRREIVSTIFSECGVDHKDSGSDEYSISVIDWVECPVPEYHNHNVIALVALSRERTYSKAYTRRFGTGSRTDTYLVGYNESGTGYAVPVTPSSDIGDAIAWIWGVKRTELSDLAYRQGDVGLFRCAQSAKSGWQDGEIEVAPSHTFRGQYIVRGNVVYVRSGVLIHKKQQHGSIHVNECMRVRVGRHSKKPNTTRSSD